MPKRQIAKILMASVILTNLNGMTVSAEQKMLVPEIFSDLAITVNNAVYEENGAVSVNFTAENNYNEANKYIFNVDIVDSDNLRIAGFKTERNINAGESVPIKLYTDSVGIEEDIKVNIYCNLSTSKYLYVSKRGNDSADGSKLSPIKTLQKAAEKIAEYDLDGKFNEITVMFDGGIYSVDKTVIIPKLNSISSVTLKAENPENPPVFTGGISVKGSNFTKVTDNKTLAKLPESARGNVYSLSLADYGLSLDFSNGSKTVNDPAYTVLYYNGNSKQLARYPNDKYAVGSIRIGKDSENKRFTIKSPDVKNWTDYDEAWLRGWPVWEWNLHRGRILGIADATDPDTDPNISGKTIIADNTLLAYMGKDEERPMYKYEKDWYIYNLLEELDIEGEYAVNDNVLYYFPNQSDVSSGAFKNAVINLNTSKNDMLKIESNNITVENMVFDNSKGLFINAEADNVKILGCEFKNDGQHAISIIGNNNLVSSCDFHDLGGRGVLMSGGDRKTLTPSNSILENCYFYRTSQIDRTNCPPVSLAGCGVTARKNTICDTPHSAFSYSGNNHIIEYNEFYNCLTDNAGDAGIIYTGNNLSNLGTTIRRNYFHESNSGLGAIYWDDRLSGQTAVENVFDGMDRALLIHGGVCNTFSGNLVIDAQYGAQVRGKGRMIKIDDVGTFNSWNEIGSNYNPYSNVFMAYLEGNYHDPKGYPAMPWKEAIWQNAYSRVLKYVNNKTNDTAEETTFQNNYFVNVPSDKAIYPYAATQMSDLTLGGNVTDADALSADMKILYDDVVKNSGLYSNEYRAVK